MRFRSLRWRIGAFYALLLVGTLLAVSAVLTFELRSALYDQAKTKIDRVATDIDRQVGPTGGIGIGDDVDALPVDQLLVRNLDHWSDPTTYLEVDDVKGHIEGKTSNLGPGKLEGEPGADKVAYIFQPRNASQALVRAQVLKLSDGSQIVLKIAEDLEYYDQTIARIDVLLALVALGASLAVIVGSFALARDAIRPIDRLNEAMRTIKSDQLDKRLGWSARDDEIGALAHSFDDMLDRLAEGFARERQFISDASHELKTPLTIINANAQMLERWADNDPKLRAESLRAIADESSALARMINGMLTLAKAESGTQVPRGPVDLGSLVAEVVRAAQPRATEKGVTLGMSGPPRLAIVLGDENLLRQVFTNLIDNAIKFTEHGSVEAVFCEGPAGAITVEVRDTGIGIDDGSLERVFDRFYRTDKSRDRNVPGTGLGLAIVRSIVRVHDGSVAARKNPDGGTIFAVSLPPIDMNLDPDDNLTRPS